MTLTLEFDRGELIRVGSWLWLKYNQVSFRKISVKAMNTTIKQAKTILNQQTITETSPGTILQDFQTFLNLLQDEGIEVSGKHSLFPLKHLAALNAQLTEPTQLDLKRPVQKSYPALNGIYLLLRTTGLAVVISEKRKQKLVLDEATYEAWNQLNVTEQYFTLLEAWLVHASDETIGERDQFPTLFNCIRFWQMLNQDEIQLTKELEGYFAFRYTLGWHNLALFDLFGLMRVEQGKPEKGKGWRVQRLEKTVYGKGILTILRFALVGEESPFSRVFQEIIQVEPIIRFGKLQPLFQPYFPQWQNSLVVQQDDSIEGIYIFKVSLGKPWRRIAIPSFLYLDDLAEAILDAFEFSDDHLYQFIGKQSTGKILMINHPFLEDPPCTDEFLVEALPLKVGQTMTFLFDLGSRWEFKLTLEEIQPLTQDCKQPQLLHASGQAPEQYDFGEEWD